MEAWSTQEAATECEAASAAKPEAAGTAVAPQVAAARLTASATAGALVAQAPGHGDQALWSVVFVIVLAVI